MQEFDLIYQGIEAAGDDELKRELYRRAVNYATIRAEWYFLTPAERIENDPKRSAAHNAFIDACNILIRGSNYSNQQVFGQIPRTTSYLYNLKDD